MQQSKRDAIDKRVRRHVIGRIRDYFAIVTPGVEAMCRRELIGLGLACPAAVAEPGGVAFNGRFVDCQRANLHARTATRILMRIERFSATNPRQLRRKCAAIPWELFLAPGPLPDIRVASHRSRLYHTDLIAGAVCGAIADRMGTPSPASNATDCPQTLYVRLENDRATLSLDSSGVPLYKRGIKQGAARAPIRETLAAAVLMAAGYDGSRPLLDPMCGSGTFSLEAAMMAKRVAPGLNRRFAFMDWPAFGERQWAFLKQGARADITQLKRPVVHASDLDADACKLLSETVYEKKMADAVSVTSKDFFDCEAGQIEGGPGLVAINPPYGIRIGSVRQATDLLARIGRHLQQAFRGWDVALIAPDRSFLRAVPFSVQQIPLMHGGVKAVLCVAKNLA